MSSTKPTMSDLSLTERSTIHPMDYPPHSRLFIKCVSPEMTEDFLRVLFATYGEVDHIQVLMKKDTNEPRGSAFVKFKTAESAKMALKGIRDNMNGTVTTSKGKSIQLEVTVAQPKQVRKVRQNQ